MYHVKNRTNAREKIKLRIRQKISGTAEKPRLSVFRSNKYIYAQLIDDKAMVTLVDVMKEALSTDKSQPKMKQAYELGKLLAQKATKKKLTQAIFDRNGYKYHGRVKMLCEGAREGGLTL